MSNAVPLYFSPDAAGSYTRSQMARPGRDALACALLLLVSSLQLQSTLHPGQIVASAALAAALGAALGWAILAPASYRRHRTSVVAALRLLCAAKLMVGGTLPVLEAETGAQGTRLEVALGFVLLLLWESGLILLTQVRARALLLRWARNACCPGNSCSTAPLAGASDACDPLPM